MRVSLLNSGSLIQSASDVSSTKSLGILTLEARGIFPEARWYWIGAGALVGYILLFNGFFVWALDYLNRKNLHI